MQRDSERQHILDQIARVLLDDGIEIDKAAFDAVVMVGIAGLLDSIAIATADDGDTLHLVAFLTPDDPPLEFGTVRDDPMSFASAVAAMSIIGSMMERAAAILTKCDQSALLN